MIAQASDSITLADFLNEAMIHNKEVMEANLKLESATALKGKTRSFYYPEIGIEGGAESYHSSQTNASNGFAFAYGRYNLYNGGKDFNAFKTQSKEQEFADFHLAKTKVRVQREVAHQFYDLLFIQEANKLKIQALEINQSQLKMAEKRKAAGITSDSDVLEFELREATLHSDLLLLEQEKLSSMREFLRILGRDETNTNIEVSGALNRVPVNKELSELISQAQNEREDLIEAKKNLSIATFAHSATLGSWFPKADFEANYGNLPRADRILTETPTLGILLKVSLPLFSGFDSYYERVSKAHEMDRAEVTMKRVEQQMKVQVEMAFSKLKTIGSRADLEEKNLDRSKRYYEITTAEYKRGIKNSLDVASATEKLFDTKLRDLQYRRDFKFAQLLLAESIGTAE